MISKNWIDSINEIKELCNSCNLPVQVNEDTNASGTDGILTIGDIPIIRDSDVAEFNLDVNLTFRVANEDWQNLLENIMLLSEKLSTDIRFIFNGWVRGESESHFEYNGNVIYRGRINADILQ